MHVGAIAGFATRPTFASTVAKTVGDRAPEAMQDMRGPESKGRPPLNSSCMLGGDFPDGREKELHAIDSYSICIPFKLREHSCHTIIYEGHCLYFYVRGFPPLYVLPCHDYLLFVVIIKCLSKYIM